MSFPFCFNQIKLFNNFEKYEDGKNDTDKAKDTEQPSEDSYNGANNRNAAK